MKKLLPWILGVVCLGNILWIMHLNSLYYLPSGSDAVHWLAHAKALINGITYPLWSEGLLQYPPVSLIILGFFAEVFGDILGMQLFGAIILGLLPLSFFILVNKMFGTRVGIVASLFIAITPVFYEMWGYGMYPNLFGFSVLFLALFAILNFIEHRDVKWGIITALMIVLVMFSHHLTSIIFVATLLLATALSFLTSLRVRELVIISLFSVLVFVLYRIIVPSQYTLFNRSAAFLASMDYGKFLWIFKDLVVFAITAICAAYGCFLIYKNRPINSFMVISLIVSSFILTYGLPLVGINLDQARFLIFSIPGFIIGVAYLVHEVGLKTKVKSGATIKNVSYKSLAIIMVVAVLIAVNGYIGVGTSWRVNTYTRASAAGILSIGGDVDIRELVEWIQTSTQEKDVFVAEQYLSKIIMGLGERRVLEAVNPAYLFMQGESERASAADSILHANYEVYHPSFRVRDQYPVQNHNPIIALWKQGNYYDAIYFADSFWQATVEKGGDQYYVYPCNIKNTTVGFLSVSYETPDVLFRRDVKIEDDGIRVVFSADSKQEGVTLSSMKICGWRPWDDNNLTNILFDGLTLTLVDGLVDARIVITDYSDISYYLADPVYEQAGFWATYEADGSSITAEFFILNNNSSQDTPVKLEAKEIIQNYDISYFAVFKDKKDQVWFMENNGYKKVYLNPLVNVYQVK